jgi:hypothetical protein
MSASNERAPLERRAGRAAHEVLRTPGEPLDGTTRTMTESRPGHDFGALRIHAGSRAARPAIAVHSVPSTVIQRECVDDGGGASHWKYEYDGCSLPARFAVTMGDFTLGGATAKDNPAGAENTAFALMKPTTSGGVACDRHDECYQSCTTTKEQCDNRMYADMKEICAKASPYVRQKCYSAAVLYYQGLRRLPQADEAFQYRKRAVCACDPALLPPALRFPPLELLRSPRGGYLNWLDYQLNIAKVVGYKAFLRQEEYESYVRGGDARPVTPR